MDTNTSFADYHHIRCRIALFIVQPCINSSALMIIYNITTKVHHSIDTAWLQWQREKYIPEIMATGLFSAYTFCRLLEQDDSEGNTYAVQYTAAGAENYQQYIQLHAPLIRKKAQEKWGDAIISFHSALEVIQ